MDVTFPTRVTCVGEGTSSPSGAPSALAFLPDGERVAVCVAAEDDTQVAIWDPVTGHVEWMPNHIRGIPRAVGCLPDGRLVGVFSPKERFTATQRYILEKGASAEGTPFFPGNAALRQERTSLSLHDLTEGSSLGPLSGPSIRCNHVAFSPNGRHLAASLANGKVIQWGLADGLEIHHLGWDVAHGITFTPDGEHLVSSGERSYGKATQHGVVVDVAASGKRVQTLKTRTRPIAAVAGSRGASLVAVSWCQPHLRGQVTVWDTATRAWIVDLPREGAYFQHLAFAPEGERLAGAVGGCIQLWDARSGTLLQRLAQLAAQYFSSLCIAFSPSGELLVSGGTDGNLRCWKVVG